MCKHFSVPEMEDLLEVADQDMYGSLPDIGLPTIREEEEEDETPSSTQATLIIRPEEIPLPPDSDEDLLVIDESQSELESQASQESQ